LENIPPPPGEISADVIWGKKYVKLKSGIEKGGKCKRKRNKRERERKRDNRN
jgi:hypothetical protein